MNKKERYYNHIVEDLVKKTEINYEEEITPFPSDVIIFPSGYLFPLHSLYHHEPTANYIPLSFIKYVEERYGARDEEVNIIWELYKERMVKQINN